MVTEPSALISAWLSEKLWYWLLCSSLRAQGKHNLGWLSVLNSYTDVCNGLVWDIDNPWEGLCKRCIHRYYTNMCTFIILLIHIIYGTTLLQLWSRIKQIQNSLYLFQVFDKHNRGYISSSDLRAVLQCLGEDLSEEESKLLQYRTKQSQFQKLTNLLNVFALHFRLIIYRIE